MALILSVGNGRRLLLSIKDFILYFSKPTAESPSEGSESIFIVEEMVLLLPSLIQPITFVLVSALTASAVGQRSVLTECRT